MVPRPPRHLRDPRAGAAHPRGAAGRHPDADPARARARGARGGSIAARSPQAKGRIERAWGTLQDRLVIELRLAGACDRDSANRVLARYLPRFNRRFAVPAADPVPAWRPLPTGTRLERICSLRYRRTVAGDGTVRAGATILQLPARANGRSRAGQRVELQLRLDGRIVVWDGERDLVTTKAPADPVQLRALEKARGGLGTPVPAGADAIHPWRRVRPGTALYARQRRARLTGSLTR